MEHVCEALRAVGIRVKRNPDWSRPHVYVTVFLDRVGATDKAWMYIGRHSAGRMTYRGSGKHLLAAVKKYGRDRFVRFVVEYTAAPGRNSCPVEQKWIDRLCVVDDVRFFNLLSSSGGLNSEDALRRARDPEWRRKNKEKMQRLSRDPEYRRNHKEAMQLLVRDPEWQRKNKEKMQRLARDPEYLQKNREGTRRYAQSVEGRRQRSESALRSARDPAILRKRMSWLLGPVPA